ncbi:DEAD/DEAH box helicase [Marihabitans asiaticum]|uniref:ATP-dependent RNA helicase HelY n=1 Tax=Marihabitans asiaticum TaxID=415218 RepID=A0A560W6I2_9MICO|nr:DEAD/DEAH box helicase [Marihabitans asiaticum]TWD13231.1 ATP-dependent RNA helicase HelY [Marihabitans asiaticum]
MAPAPLDEFAATLDFALDDFQTQGCEAIAAGHGVLVAAPTGAGKTVVGEFAVHLALQRGQKAFYTTPIKALSNQKYHELAARHGHDQVGLLTGDTSINGEAPVVVMTTEVLRNMIYAGSATLDQLGFVVMDEVHYLADRFRGAVWEEVIIHLPQSVQLVSLSATVSNAEEFGAWLAEVRGGNEIVVSETRPVPLWQHMQVQREVYDLFAGGATPDPSRAARVNPRLLEAIRSATRSSGEDPPGRRDRGGRQGGRERGRRGESRPGRPGAGGRFGGAASRTQVIEQLDREGLLPAITFIFSRAGCEGAVGQLLANDVRLISSEEGRRNRRTLEERSAVLEGEDLSVLGYHQLLAGLERGYAPHHAGMLPIFREVVEELFTAGRVKAVFATETLALGINMPARTVVIERLVKFNGEAHVDITPAEYTQLTGRAGRRGIDVEGHALVVWSRGMDPEQVAGLASTRTYPLRSSFAPTYNMAVNLVATVGRATAREILETSFAQFQADRSVVGLATTLRSQQESLDGYAEAMHCDLGDFREYAQIRHRITELEKAGRKQRSAARRAETAVSLEALRRGDVIMIGGRRSGRALVVQPAKTYKGRPGDPLVLTEHKQVRRLEPHDLDGPVTPFATVDVPKGFNPRSPKHRSDLAATLRIKAPQEAPPPPIEERARQAAAGTDGKVEELRSALRAHPCHACPDREEHARWSQRWWRLKREQAQVQRTVDSRTGSVAATFERICGVLTDLGYLDGDGETVTADGARLRRLYSDKDLLAAQCLRSGSWQRLDPAELAAVVSMLVHEPRRDETDLSPRLPTDGVVEAWQEMQVQWAEIEAREHTAGLDPTRHPDAGIAWEVHRWASGRRLDEVLGSGDMTAGDFVRRCKQLVDLLDQVAKATEDQRLRRTARSAIESVMRGVVAADRID